MAQVTPDKADGMRQTEELRFSIGPAAVDAAGDESEEKRMPNDLGQLGPAIVEDKTSAEQDEIRELKALMDEPQTQVQCAGRLAALAADWIVASPGATVQEIQRRLRYTVERGRVAEGTESERQGGQTDSDSKEGNNKCKCNRSSSKDARQGSGTGSNEEKGACAEEGRQI